MYTGTGNPLECCPNPQHETTYIQVLLPYSLTQAVECLTCGSIWEQYEYDALMTELYELTSAEARFFDYASEGLTDQ